MNHTYGPRASSGRLPLVALVAGSALLAAVLFGGALAGPRAAGAQSGDYTFEVRSGGQAFRATLPANSVATFKWTQGGASAGAWLTTPKASGTGLVKALEPSTIALGAPASAAKVIDVDPGERHQAIDGFGGALTDSSAKLIAASPKRAAIMDDLFASSGARFTFVRLPMGATDFVADGSFQSYDDMPGTQTDPQLEHFSIAHDTVATIPLLKQARTLSPSLKLLATPWSAPAWMKFANTFDGTCTANGNYLRNEFYGAYASYFAKFVHAYQVTHGLPIHMVSMQNEPRNCNSTYPTMNMEPGDQAAFSRDLRTALDGAGFGATRILAWDHNWIDGDGSATRFPQQALECAGGRARAPIDAVGFHSYGGETLLAGVQTAFQQACEGTDIYFTEATGFFGAPNTASNLVYAMRYNLIGPIRNGARASTYWNLALDERSGPHRGGCGDCRGMITVKDDGTYAVNEDYVYWKHFSKHVDPGAVRIGSTDLGQGAIETVAFRNPDQTIVLVALHGGSVGSPAEPAPPPPPPPPAVSGLPAITTIVGGVVGTIRGVLTRLARAFEALP